MRERTRSVLNILRALGLGRALDAVVLPAIADIQHEYAETTTQKGRTWTFVRGCWSIVAGVAAYVAHLPARQIREQWMGVDPAGPRLLRLAAPVTAVVVLAVLGIFLTSRPAVAWRAGIGVGVLVIPSALVVVAPLALAIGIGWALVRDRSCAPAAATVGLVAAVLLFAFWDLTVPRANQAYRTAMAESGKPPRKGNREMTFRELQEAAASRAPMESASTDAGCSCARGASASALRLEWHKRLSMSALAVPFALLAVALAQFGRKAIVAIALWLSYALTGLALRLGERFSVEGDVPAIVGAWTAHLVPLALLAILRLRVHPPAPFSAGATR